MSTGLEHASIRFLVAVQIMPQLQQLQSQTIMVVFQLVLQDITVFLQEAVDSGQIVHQSIDLVLYNRSNADTQALLLLLLGGFIMLKLKTLSLFIPCIIAISLFTACSKQYNTSNTYVAYQDDQYTYKSQGSFSNMAESEDGYYFLCGYYLFYADKSTMKPVILCNKPNCLHEDETDPNKVTSCNAFFPGLSSGSVSFFDGYVYVLERDIDDGPGSACKLVKLFKDGTNRKTVLQVKYKPTSLAIHRGKAYVAGSVYDKDGTSIYGIREYDLSKSASQKPETIFDGKITGGAIQDIICYGQNLYFNEFAMNSEIITVRIQHYDLNTKKTTCIMKENKDSFPSELAFYKDLILSNYTTLDYSSGEVIQVDNYLSNLDGSKRKKSFPTDNYQNLYSDGKYIYLDDVKWSPFSKPKEKQSLTVVDTEGNPIASTPTGDYSTFSSNIICGSKEHLFLENQTDTTYQIYYANKNEFTSGKINFNLMFEIPLNKMTHGYSSNTN